MNLNFMIFTSGYKYSKKLCEKVSLWYYRKFLMNYEINIEIVHKNLNSQNSDGFCQQESQNSYLIEIHNQLSKEEYIKTLLHEMVHVYQYVRGDLSISNGTLAYRSVSCQDLEYENQPHEIEAHSLEAELYEEFLKC